MPKVLSLVSYPFLPAKTGGQRGIAVFNRFFSQRVSLECVTTRSNDPSAADGYLVRNILSDSKWRYINFFYFFKVRSLILKEGYSHLILEHPYWGWMAVLLKWTCKVKLIVHSHNLEGLRWKSLGKWWWPMLWAYECGVHRLADYNFFIQDSDREYAIRRFGLNPAKCLTMTYGIEWDRVPDPGIKRKARELLENLHGISSSTRIFLFNGAFGYGPNRDALQVIVEKILPKLRNLLDFPFVVVICGKDIPESVSQRIDPQLHCVGFVPDILPYFLGADLFLNPVCTGGGIKTKLVEALGNDLNAVSTMNGALGVDPTWCNGKLWVCADYDWDSFCQMVQEAVHIQAHTPDEFFRRFYWGYTTEKAAAFIQS